MQKIMKNKGITLIALVITIIILLILAGVTISTALSENGLFKQAKKAVKNYDTASEMETLNIAILNYNITNKEEDKIGKKLSKKDVSNPNWHIIKDEENIYADGWYFVKQGDELPNGSNAKNNWVINYETGEVKQLEEKEYDSITIEDTIAVKEDIIINLDSAMVDDNVENNKESIEKNLGTGVKLHNFDFSNDGLINNEFVFDGENDFITIDYKKTDNTNNKEWFENGFTFEFYGSVENGKHIGYNNDNHGQDISEGNPSNVGGIFQITEKNDDYTNDLTRVVSLIAFDANPIPSNFILTFAKKNDKNFYSDEFDFDEITSWWKSYKINNNNKGNHYYTLSVLKNENNTFIQKFYEDGKIIKSGELNKNCMEQISEMEKNLMTIGAFEEGYSGKQYDNITYQASLAKMNVECLRIYNRGLTDTEIQANYKKTTEYHSLMESSE